MKVKMLEVVQGSGIEGVHDPDNLPVTVLQIGEIYQVADTLGAWLLEHRKAIEIKPEAVPHYGAQPKPEERHDEIKEAEVLQPFEEQPDKKRRRK